MVHVYNCHPFAAQRIVPVEQEPGLVCCGGGALFVLSAGGCKVEVYQLQQEPCPLICRFSTMDIVQSIVYSTVGDYLVTIEKKNDTSYLRAYTNWRCQEVEKQRVGVRMLGHLIRGQAFRSAPKEQMEIIEMPLSEMPRCVACCPLTGSLLVACTKSVVLFGLKRQKFTEQLDALDFERLLILDVPGWCPSQVALCGGYVALQMDLEVLVVKLENLWEGCVPAEDHKGQRCDVVSPGSLKDKESQGDQHSPVEPDGFIVFKKEVELLGDDAKDCGVSVSLEWTGLETEASKRMGVTYVMYRRFAPDFYQNCNVEETRLHSLQLHHVYTGNQEVRGDLVKQEPECVFCCFSLPSAGFVYSLKNSVELISTYQYPEKAHQAVLCDRFLYVITRNALQCFSVRCSAVAARLEDPYIDTTMKACPPNTMEVCALRIQLFIGLKSLYHDGNHVVLLTAADVESKAEPERAAKRTTKKSSVSKLKEPNESGHGWNLYVIDTVSTLQLYREMVDYSKRYERTNPASKNCLHLLSEAHLLLRASLLCPSECESTDKAELQDAFLESCAQLGDCFSRLGKRDYHLALPYYKMSGLSVTEVIARNVAICKGTGANYGNGFLFFLKHSLSDESMEELSSETANTVLEVFSKSEPGLLPYVVSSSFMKNVNPTCARAHLDQLELSGAPSVTLTLCKATQALRLGDLQYYQQQMDRHAEMLQVFGFIEEPKLLVHGGGRTVVPTQLARHLRDTQDGLLVAAVVALHENSKLKLDEAELFFQELCKDSVEPGIPQLLVDFWEALLVASSQGSIIHELLFHLISVYIERITCRERAGIKALKTAEDLINSSSHYGPLFPWVSILTPAQFNITHDHQEDLQKLQSLLCGPTLEVSSIVPLLEQLPDADNVGLSIHLLCATKLGQHKHTIERLLDRCPQAIIPYANHELHDDKRALWWEKLFPELCKRTRVSSGDNTLLSAMKETLQVLAMRLNPLEFLDLLPDDGSAHFFLPHLLDCSQKHLLV